MRFAQGLQINRRAVYERGGGFPVVTGDDPALFPDARNAELVEWVRPWIESSAGASRRRRTCVCAVAERGTLPRIRVVRVEPVADDMRSTREVDPPI